MEQIAELSQERKSKFPLTNCSYWLLLTIPVNVARDEHTFSCLKIVKRTLRTMMRVITLESLLNLSNEKDITDSIDIDIMVKY